MPQYSDFVRDDYERPIPGALAQLFAIDGTTLIDTDTAGADGQFTVTGPDAKCILQVSYGGVSERSVVLVGNPPEYVGPTGPANSTYPNLTALKAAPATNGSYILTTPTGAITYAYVTGDYSATPEAQLDVDVVKLNAVPLTTGALVRRKDVVRVTDYRRAGDTDDTGAFTRAQAAAERVYVPGRQGLGPNGEYIVDNVGLLARTEFYGDRGSTAIRPPVGVVTVPGARTKSIFFANSGGENAQVVDVTLRDLMLYGRVESEGFLEHCHLIEVMGVRRFLCDHVSFRGFRGDAIILEGQEIDYSNGNLSPRHNIDVTIRNCDFDGINNNNRNGVSIVDGVNVKIDHCTYRNVTKSGNTALTLDPMNPGTGIPMPGPIDIEPNPYAFYVIQNIQIILCTFDKCGGNFGAIGIFIPSEVTFVPTDILIDTCNFRSSIQTGTGADVMVVMNRDLGTTTTSQNIVVRGCSGFGGKSPYFIRSARGVTIDETNRWEQYAFAASVGYINSADKVYDIITRATLVRVGMSAPSQFGMAIFNAIRMADSTRYIDCGDGSANAAAVALLTGASSEVTRDGVLVASPSGFTKRSVFSDGHNQTPATNRTGIVDDGGLPSVFSATAPGQIIRGTFDWAPGQVGRNNPQVTSFTVPGVGFGDTIEAGYSQQLNPILDFECRVHNANEVLVRITTSTDIAITPPAGTVTVKVTKR